MMQHKLARLALLSLLAVVAAACGDDGVAPEPGVAQLRIVNAANVQDVQVRRVGTTAPLAENLDFREFTQTCVEVPAGEHAFVFGASGVELATTAATFEANKSYTAFLAISGPTRRAVVVADDEIASAGNNALAFINATSASGDVYVTSPTGAVGPNFLVHAPLSPLALTNEVPSYVHRSTEHTRIRLFNPGTTTGTPRADFTLAGLPASRRATVVFTEVGTPAGPTAFVVTPCS
jgi:hypothetical protein